MATPRARLGRESRARSQAKVVMAEDNHLKWTNDLSVGNAELDAQHKEMLHLLNDLYDLLERAHTRKSVDEFINDAEKFAEVHFESEERLMRQAGFPDIEEHHKAHQEYRGLVEQIRQRPGVEQGMDLFFFLKEWWLGHLYGPDRDYITWLATLSATRVG